MSKRFLRHDAEKTREELLQELAMLRKRVVTLEASQACHRQTIIDLSQRLEQTSLGQHSDRAAVRPAASDQTTSDPQAASDPRPALESPLPKVYQSIATVLESLSDAFISLDRNWRYIYVNAQAEKIIGQPRAVLINRLIWEQFPEWGRAQVYEKAQQAVAEQMAIVYEAFVPSLNQWFSVRMYPSYQGLSICFLDITERKLAEQALENALRRLNFHVEHSPLGIVEWNRDFQVTRWSHRAEAMFGWQAEEVLGKQLTEWEFVHPEDRARVHEIMEQLVQGQAQQIVTLNRNFTRTGTIVYCEWYGSALFDQSGELESVLVLMLDITQRQRIEDALQLANRKAFSILETISEGFITLNEQWRCTYLNPQGERILGCKPEEVLGQSIWEVFPNDPDLRFGAQLQRVMLDRVAVHFQDYSPHLELWVDCYAYPLSTGGICLYFQDISARKQMEHSLEINRQRLDLVLRASDVGIWFCDLPSQQIEWDDKCREHFDLPPDATGTMEQFIDLLHPSDREGTRRAVARAIEEGTTYDVTHRRITPDGQVRWIRAIGSVFRDPTGQPRRFDGITVNVTEQKQQEEERDSLLYREQVARQLAELNIARVTQLQELTAALAQTLTKSEVIEVLLNQGLAAFGASRGWVAQRPSDTANSLEVVGILGYHDQDIKPFQRVPLTAARPVTDATRSGKIVLVRSPHDYRTRYPDIAERYIASGTQSFAAIPLSIDDRVIGAIGFSFPVPRDFSDADCSMMLTLARQCAQALERARLYQAERRARETAEAANRVKDEFLAVLSHELRSPLNPILGWSKLLQLRKFDAATTQQALQTIERNAQLQTQLIDDLLDVSRILQGQLNLNISVVNLVGPIEAALETVRLAAEAKSITIHTDLDGSVGSVVGDPARLQQIVWNLLSNAVKFTSAGGCIEVQLSHFQNHLAPPPEQGNPPFPTVADASYAQITVSDTGKGISPDFLPYVFDYFRQADSTSTRRFGGLGLGLAIVRHLVELHGGMVLAASPGEGQGSSFTVLLPLLKETYLTAAPLDRAFPHLHTGASPLSGIHVLAVDDEPDMRQFIAFVLAELGAEATVVKSASEALHALHESSPHVILSDIGMPEMDGYRLMQQVRGLAGREGRIPAIALTAYAAEFNQQRALAVGFQLHLAKPIDPEALVAAIRQLVQL